MTDILEHLRGVATREAARFPDGYFKIRGVSRTEYVLQLSRDETVFHLDYIVAQTVGQGSCHYDRVTGGDPTLAPDLIGQDALKVRPGSRALEIALLDSVFASFRGEPRDSYTKEGTNIEKAPWRAEIVCREALSLVNERKPKNGKLSVVNVGVVGGIVKNLIHRDDTTIACSDFSNTIVGRRVHGVRVEHGSRTNDLVAGADLAIITGMTLATGTLEEIIESAKQNNTAIAMFAETGANFASVYCELGIHLVISEPFPFYLVDGGMTTLDIFERARGR